jgi:glycosyltransferase involved in cell wall biosynthesis
MTFCIITHVIHTKVGEKFFGYAPYVNEMNIWIKNADKVIIVAPLDTSDINPIHQSYSNKNIIFISVPHFSFTTLKNIFLSLLVIPTIIFKIFKAIYSSDHIHLRCPGNMGLLGVFIQIFFPNKAKTAKYAGNWDPKSKQPLSYKIQKSILSNTFLTRKMKVLIYGEWKNLSKNCKQFFTATYFESEKETISTKLLNNPLQFIFVGTLSKGKQPLYAIQLVESLKNKGHDVQLSIYGDGNDKQEIIEYIHLKGNSSKEQIKEVYKNSHFLVLPSKSEGWPKVVAEAMFWGCLPIATSVSCISNMLDDENRGILLTMDNQLDVKKLEAVISNQETYTSKINNAINWSRMYTIDKFENEIMKLL